MTQSVIRLALHGGAGAMTGTDYERETAHMRTMIALGHSRLCAGASALDVTTEIVAELESSGLYIAGRGSSPNLEGEYELDACVIDGISGRAGAVAALQGFASPIRVARAVMDRTPHVMMAAGGAGAFARSCGMTPIADAASWYTKAGSFEFNRLPMPAHGTVGCVARDRHGHLAAATSTGGVFGKLPGRVGDSALVGSSTWADAEVAVSCTGQGEFFIRVAAAAQIAHRIRFGGESLASAAESVLAEIVALGGTGGLIAVDRHGNVVMPFKSTGMKRAALSIDGMIDAHAP